MLLPGFGHGGSEVGAAILGNSAEHPDRRVANDLARGIEALDLKAHALRQSTYAGRAAERPNHPRAGGSLGPLPHESR